MVNYIFITFLHFFETPFGNWNHHWFQLLALLYLGIIATGLAWLIRFKILTTNGLVFQTQVAYLIPIFGVFFGYFLMEETITWKVLASLVVILVGIYIFKKIIKVYKIFMGTESIESSFLSIYALLTFFTFLLVSKLSHKINNGVLLDLNFTKPQAFHSLAVTRSGGLGAMICFKLFLGIYYLLYSKIPYDYLFVGFSMFLLDFWMT